MTDRLLGRDSNRLLAIDVVRGFVMVLMTLDHASSSFNAGRLMSDSAAAAHAGGALDPMQFAIRWVTHLCAPTFVMLAGASLALSATRRLRDGVPGSAVDRDILIRGALLIAIDVVWMSWVWKLGTPVQLGVLYAIGASMIGMIALRRLPALVVGGLGVAIMVGGEALTGQLDPGQVLTAATLSGGRFGPLIFFYPFLPWTGFMMVGWALGVRLAGPGMRARDWGILAAIAAVTFVVVRGLDSYGNAHLQRGGSSWIDWLHVSKYPPSLAYAALELAIAFALLAATWRWAKPWRPLVVLGQTALFFYVLHVHLLKIAALALGLYKSAGIGVTVIAWLAMVAALYPLSRWYLAVKRRHPTSALRFL
ncbi:MAG: DUF1624 domain-containing protein [Myxococcales bacterium]|nr:DUF1624 domain-containing protein [Myxococcales bacterium]